jgi:uncharacterized protein (DUF362 family)
LTAHSPIHAFLIPQHEFEAAATRGVYRPPSPQPLMKSLSTRRQFLQRASAVGAGLMLPSLAKPLKGAIDRPTAPVSLGRCRSYQPDTLLPKLATLMDQVGGLAKQVAGKTVAVKVNLTGDVHQPALGLPPGRTYHVHPNVVLATATLLDRAGARRIRFLEGTYQNGPMEDYLQAAGWDLKALSTLKAKVEYEDTHNLGSGRRYHEVKVPWGGSLYPAYLLNHSYIDCDVYISLAKLKNHATAGVTLSMKNNFGITPTSLYSHRTRDEKSTSARVEVFHTGAERPPDGVPQELEPHSPHRPSYRVPRHVVDAIGIRPINLAILDGIETVSGGEGPWLQLTGQKPGLLLAGRNAVCTDAVAATVMGYDPMAKSATGPFPGDNHLALAAALGLGTNNVKEIEILGLSLKEALYPFGWEPDARNN